MKAIWKTTLLATLAVMACVREEEKAVPEPVSQEIPDGYHMVTIKAGREADDELTKTIYANDKIFSWTSGDQISVLFNNGSANKFFTFTTTGTGTSATFSGLVEDGYDFEGATGGTKWALFPANSSHVYNSDTDIKFHIPEQDNGSVCNIPMIAQNVSTEYLFHHMAGAIKFTFRGLTANQNVKLSFDSKNDNRYTSGLFSIQELSTGVSNAILRGNQHEAGAKKTRNVTATASAAGTAVIYMPLPLSETPGGDNKTHSEYWAYFDFDLNDADTDASILEVHRSSGSFPLDKGKVTAVGAVRVAGSEPLGGITVDGNFSDWDGHSERYIGSTLGEVKATADRSYLYIYQKFNNYNFTYDNWDNYQYVYVDTDNDNTSGSTETSQGYGRGAEKRWKFFIYFDHASYPYYYRPDESTPFANWSGSWTATELTGFTESTMYKAVKTANNLEIEYCIPLSALGITPDASLTKDFAIGIKGSYMDGSGAGTAPVTNRITVTIPAPAAPGAAPAAPFSFTEATEDYDNPERGLYNQTSFYFDGSSIPSLSISSSHVEPLELVLFYLTGYKDKNLDDDVTDAISTVFSNLRAAGKKAIVRFGYTSAHGDGDKPWDAGLTQMRSHIAQIKPILTANEDIIYVVQAGFIGTYGEWYYTGSGLTTDDFYYSVSGGTLTGYANRAQIITDLLDAVPASRQLALRTPFYKRYYFHQTDPSNYDELTDWTAISDLSMDNANKRLAFFNDAFLANNDNDTGTFNSDTDWNMWRGQSAYLITGGETAYQDAEPNPVYSASSVALGRIASEHISYLNKNTENKIMKSWIDAGKLNDIKKALGYRLVATSGEIGYSSTTAGSTVTYSISIKNKGSVRVIYPRPCKLVYLHLGSPTPVVENLGDVRNLLPGADASTFSGSFTLPINAEAGDKIAIWMPDSAAGLQSNPAYSIRLSNSDISWENGYNVIYTF